MPTTSRDPKWKTQRKVPLVLSARKPILSLRITSLSIRRKLQRNLSILILGLLLKRKTGGSMLPPLRNRNSSRMLVRSLKSQERKARLYQSRNLLLKR